MRNVFVVFMLLFVIGCVPTTSVSVGGSTTANPPSVSPASAELEASATQQFISSEANTTWSVQESGGGSITVTGLYTAPAVDGTYHVLSTATDGRTGKSVVKVRKTVVAVNPLTASIAAGGSTQFTASVTGPTDTSANWSVLETGGGTITAAGLYTAPATPGTYHVKAVSTAVPTKSATATVTVTSVVPISISVSPASATVNACSGSIQLGTILTGTTDTRVVWGIQETGGGTVTSGGFYTPPTAGAGVVHVTATSVADPTKVAIATITVAEKVLGVTVTPNTAQVLANGQTAFTAMVTTSCGTFAAQ